MQVYLATNKTNGKRYVGVTTQPMNRRMAQHKSRAGQLNSAFPNAIQKYGMDGFAWEVIATCADAEALAAAESFYIRALNTRADGGHGYNRTSGGGGVLGIVFSEDSRAKMSASQRRARPRRIGRQLSLVDPKIGKPHKPAHVEKIREAMRGKFNARRLHPELAPEIFAKLAAGRSQTEIAPEYGVSRPAISLFVKKYRGQA
jgi:group I intron endonuclease